jgi:hypothetical protein
MNNSGMSCLMMLNHHFLFSLGCQNGSVAPFNVEVDLVNHAPRFEFLLQQAIDALTRTPPQPRPPKGGAQNARPFFCLVEPVQPQSRVNA